MKLALMTDEKASTSRRLASGRACPDEMCIWELGTNGALSPPPCRPYPVRDTVTGARMNIQAGIPSSGGEARHPAAKANGMAMRCPGQSLGQSLRMGCQFFCIRRRCIGQSPSCRAGNQAIPFHPSIHHSLLDLCCPPPPNRQSFAIRRRCDGIISMSVCAFACLCSCPLVSMSVLYSMPGPALTLDVWLLAKVYRILHRTLNDTASDSFLLRCCRVEAQVRLISLGPCWPGICSNPASVIAVGIPLERSMESWRHELAMKKMEKEKREGREAPHVCPVRCIPYMLLVKQLHAANQIIAVAKMSTINQQNTAVLAGYFCTPSTATKVPGPSPFLEEPWARSAAAAQHGRLAADITLHQVLRANSTCMRAVCSDTAVYGGRPL